MIANVRKFWWILPVLIILVSTYCHRVFLYAPTLISPTDGASFSEDPPTFEWNLEPLAESYLIRITQNSSQQDIVYDTLADTTYTLSKFLFLQTANGTYAWTVASLCEEEEPRWSEVRSFEISKSTSSSSILISPEDKSVFETQPPQFIWHHFEEANGYILRIARDSFMLGELLLEDTLNDTNYTMTKSTFQSAVNGNYVWSVAPLIYDDKVGWWEFRTLTINKPLPGAPSLITPQEWEEFDTEPPTFIWHSEALATSYWLLLYGYDLPFPDTLISDTITDTTFALDQKLFDESFNGDYQWKVASVSTAGELIWSESRNLAFHKPLPELNLDTTYFPLGLEYKWVYESYNEYWEYYDGGTWYDTATITVVDSIWTSNGWCFKLEGTSNMEDKSETFFDVGDYVSILGKALTVFGDERICIVPEPRSSQEEGFEVSYKGDTLYLLHYRSYSNGARSKSTYRLKGIGVVKQTCHDSREHGWVSWDVAARLLYFIKDGDTVWRHQE